MALNILNQKAMNLQSDLFMTSMLKTNFNKINNNNSFYAKKGEPMYQEAMDSDRDGVVSFDEFKEYCKNNNISSKDMKDMIELRMAYRMSQASSESAEEAGKTKKEDFPIGNLDLIYANDGDGNYSAELDINKDKKVSYNEYLRYCEQNARMEAKNSDTKVVDNNSKSKFMTVSFGHASNAYNRAEVEVPEGKVEGKA